MKPAEATGKAAWLVGAKYRRQRNSPARRPSAGRGARGVSCGAVANRIVTMTMECPHCCQEWAELVEVRDNPETYPETEHGKDTATCPNCGHVESEGSFVGYADDVWRVPGANPAFP